MLKEKLKLLDILFAAGYTTEAAVAKIGLPEILALGKLSYAQIELLVSLQQHAKSNTVLQWLAEGTTKKAEPPVQEV